MPSIRNNQDCLTWYASYGSNLKRQRFMCYIEGGIPEYRTEPNEGSRDRTPPTQSRPVSFNLELYFAGRSRAWGDGGVAFLRQGAKQPPTLGRMYLITDEQFNDVVMQENSRRVDGSRFVPSFEQLVRDREHLLPGNSWYGKLLNIGTEEGYPILTFTTARTDLLPNPNAPSEQYLKTIASGIKETYPEMTNDEISEYLLRVEGVAGRLAQNQVKVWVRDA